MPTSSLFQQLPSLFLTYLGLAGLSSQFSSLEVNLYQKVLLLERLLLGFLDEKTDEKMGMGISLCITFGTSLGRPTGETPNHFYTFKPNFGSPDMAKSSMNASSLAFGGWDCIL